MALVDNIPLPKTGMEAFDTGMTNSQNIFNSLVANRKTNALLPGQVQAQGDAHLLAPYTRNLTAAEAANQYAAAKRSNEMLKPDLQKAADEHAFQTYRQNLAQAQANQDNAAATRSNELLPADKIKYADEHLQAAPQREFTQSEADKNKQLIKQAEIKSHFDMARAGFDDFGNPLPSDSAPAPTAAPPIQAPQLPPTQSTGAFDSLMNSGSPMDTSAMTPANQSPFQNSSVSPTVGNMPNTPVPNSLEMYPALAQKISQMRGGNANSAPAPAAPPAPSPQTPNLTSQADQQLDSNNPKVNPVIELQPAKKGDEWKDRIAGSDFQGSKAPGITTEYKDGMIIRNYPSGRVTAQQAGPTLDEKQAALLNRQNAYNESKTTTATVKQLNDAAMANYSLSKEAQRGLDILLKNSNSTGLFKGVAAKSHLSNDPDTASLTTIFGNIQSGTAQQADPKGAVGALRWAATIKPSILNGNAYNISQLQEVIKTARDKYEEANRQSIILTGKPLRVPFGANPEKSQTKTESSTGGSKPDLIYNPQTKKFEKPS